MIQISKGVFDLLPTDPDPSCCWREIHLWHYVEKNIRVLAETYGFSEIRTPLFEKTELFSRSIGQTTDIVTKEMYTFEDKGKRSLTLRPEGTACVMRSFIEKNLAQLAPVHKFYYIMPMFRYERMQAGRYRQHHQFGIEAIGNASYLQDVEGILLLFSLFKKLGIEGLCLHLNTLGDKNARTHYSEALKEYLSTYYKDLSEDSQHRFGKNTLRILDSKDPGDQKILKDAPSIMDFVDNESQEHFTGVCETLKSFEVPLMINPLLVRGIDYYNKTVFEITSKQLGAQNALGGGGRYDGLLPTLGGPDLPSFGFGAGLERIIQVLLAQKVQLPEKPHPKLLIIPLGLEAQKHAFSLVQSLRNDGIHVEMEMKERKLQKTLKVAALNRIPFVGILGEKELNKKIITLKNMDQKTQKEVPFASLKRSLCESL